MAQNRRDRNAWSDTVAAQLRAERAASGMTQKQIIDATGLGRSTYIRLEAGDRVADTSQLAAILAVLGLPMSEFMRRVEERMIGGMDITDNERADLMAAIERHRPARGVRDRQTGS